MLYRFFFFGYKDVDFEDQKVIVGEFWRLVKIMF